jgi:Flp pilus assembly pilin Flp
MSHRTNSHAVPNVFERMHRDESGPITVEWVVATVIAIIVILAIAGFAGWMNDTHSDATGEVMSSAFLAGEEDEVSNSETEEESEEETASETTTTTEDESDDTWDPEFDGYPPVSGFVIPGMTQPADSFYSPDFPWYGSDQQVYVWSPDEGWTIIGTW